MSKPVVVIPNWDGADDLRGCLDSVIAQSVKAHVIVVDNGSADGSAKLVQKDYPGVELIRHTVNKGYAGGVNPGFKRAIELGAAYVAPFNNDAVADKYWLERLVKCLGAHSNVGIATCKLLTADGKRLDSTGDYYTNWGLPYPRGRGESAIDKYDNDTEIFGASGGASLYRVSMLEEIGLFDEDFFAYYEDVDLSFRSQLAGWKVRYVPESIAYHQIGSTSSRMKDFTTYQTMKNLQMLYYKNVPRRYMFRVGWRLTLTEALFIGRAFSRRQGWAAIKGDMRGSLLVLSRKTQERRRIQRAKKVSDKYIWSMMVHDLPPNARALRALRSRFWKLRGKQA